MSVTQGSPETHSFRSAEPADLDWLIELRLATMAAYIEASGKKLTLDDQRARVLQDFESIKIIQIADQDVGMIKVVRNPAQWQLVQIQLLPEFQNAGFGSTIIINLVREAKDHAVPLSLSVLKTNPSKRLYDRLGFKVTRDKERSFEMRLDV